MPLVFLDFPRGPGRAPLRVAGEPATQIVARRLPDVRPALHAVSAAVARGHTAVGYVAYEAAPAFDPALIAHPAPRLPLLWFGLFPSPPAPPPRAPAPALGPFALSAWHSSLSRQAYDEAIAAIRAAIARGETYQVNYSFRLRATLAGDDFAFFDRLRAAQQPAYAAYLDLGPFRVLSASPELFFHWREGEIWTRPMKGTARRGRWPDEDEARAAWLRVSEKNRAENVMIVDLLRNDLGRIAETGSVRVPRLFDVERYPTVWQMTSTVAATARAGLTLDDVFAALFPCGSVTGAPKVSTMRLIAELEPEPREVYCGAIGVVTPEEALWSVAIRTAWLDVERGLVEYGVGGGITWDSTADDEYGEAQSKAVILTAPQPRFDLLETLRLEAGEYALLDRHLARLAASARYFGRPFPATRVRVALAAHARQHPSGVRRVRLLLDAAGAVAVESQPLQPLGPLPLRVALAAEPVDRHDRLLFHKTTHRALYERHRAARPLAGDVLLWNEAGELTEFTIGNLVLERDGTRWTPPLDCGLLPGTQRAEELARGTIRERVLTRADLARATRVWLLNSVRGWVPVTLGGQAANAAAPNQKGEGVLPSP